LIDKNEETSDDKGHCGDADDDGIDNNLKRATKDNEDDGYAGAQDKTLMPITDMSLIDKEKKLSEAEASDKDGCRPRDVGCIQNVMIDDDGASNHQSGREAADSDLDGDLYQDHHVADHFVASAAVDLLPHHVLNEFGGTKAVTQVKIKSRFDADDPPANLMAYKLGRERGSEGHPDIMVQVHTIDFAEAYDQVQVAGTMDDAYNHPDPIHRDKWRMTIEKELRMTKWMSCSPSLLGVAEDAADLFTMEMPGEYWMLIKKFIWKAKEMDQVSQE